MSEILTVSNKAAKIYIYTILATSMLLISVVIGVNYVSIKNGGTGITALDLYKYQMAKLDNAEDVEIVFLGDSSLGHAIDAKHFSDLAQKKTLNLALTGSYGLLGSYNMLRHSVSKQPVKTAVIMQSLDIFSEPISYVGYHQTLADLDSPKEISINLSTYFDIYFNIGIFAGIFKAWRSSDPSGMIAEVISDDYVIQGAQMDESSIQQNIVKHMWQLESIVKERYIALKLINKYCNENNINCIFTTSPYLEQACNKDLNYIDEVINLAVSTGITTLNNQICFPSAHIGDSFNHVNKFFKVEYTELYYGMLEQKYQ